MHLIGFNGKECPLRATVREATTGEPAAFMFTTDVGTFEPESSDDRANLPVTVRVPPLPGTYYVEFALYDDDGTTVLDESNSTTFQIQG